MSAQRGYYGAPRHEVQKRTYRPCTKCGKSTWSPRGLCSTCSGRAAYHRQMIMNGHTTAEAKRERAQQIYELLRDTDELQQDIAARFGITRATVHAIRNGQTHTKITGGYVLRPAERGES